MPERQFCAWCFRRLDGGAVTVRDRVYCNQKHADLDRDLSGFSEAIEPVKGQAALELGDLQSGTG